ncbi:MAG TPA: hypothetical protein PLH70_02630 [Bacteroidales bacterium]|nr:hypothetical protein [Bacteroidales bacterium]HOH22766.1 hypothetical protein [Bacteroidales bacterium]HPB56980.1 hypothetical protein [Bacteroidales bacterium]HPZ03300.1 hypothetical protein [Bacteroidales bacterium]HQB74683.1 hypothetical protein [Bacteroidales bacterium]
MGKQIEKSEIADLIGSYFPEIEDKLLNLFQLEEMKEKEIYKSYDLIDLAINTKIEKLKPFPFIKAIPFNKTKRYIKWALIPVLLLVVILTIKSEIVVSSSKRIIQHQKHFEKPAPYTFNVLNKSLTTFQNDDFVLEIQVEGEEVPKDLYIEYNNLIYKCLKKSNTHFTYTFTNLQKSLKFKIQTEEVVSIPYDLTILAKPIIVSYTMELKYPQYVNKRNEIIENNGDATVPEGTTIVWNFYTKNSDVVQFILPGNISPLQPKKDHSSQSLRIKEDLNYQIVTSNINTVSVDTLLHEIRVLKDLYPEIAIESQQDSLFADRVYFKGTIQDDYGFKKLNFNYSLFDESGTLKLKDQTVPIKFDNQLLIQDFYFYFDASIISIQPGEKIEYFFEVFDNDEVNGSKSTKSPMQIFKLKTFDEIHKEIDKNIESSKSDLQDLIDQSAKLVKQIENFQQKLIQQSQINWQEKKVLETLLEKYNDIRDQIDQIRQNHKDNQMLEEQYKDINKEILKKQEELIKRFDDILSDEVKEMLQKLQEMMQNQNKDQIQKEMDKLKMSAQDINKELDQQMELFKLLEFEKKFQEVIDQTRKLAEDQLRLSNQMDQKDLSKEQRISKQNSLNDRFQELQKNLQQLQKQNQELEEPAKLKNRDQQQEEIESEMNEALQNLQKSNNSRAKNRQQSASDKLNQLADDLEQEKNEAENEDLAEDIETLRLILNNLLRVSFKQENNIKLIQSINARSPLITDASRAQKEILDYMSLIGDSLSQLAKRQTAVKPFIQKELSNVEQYLQSIQTDLSDRRLNTASASQQFALTSINNLSLMLAESLKEVKEMKQQSDGKCNKKGGNSSCSKPGSGKSKPRSARELQQQLNRQMEALKRSQDQKGKQQGKGQESQSMSEQFAKMAAQQEAIRKMLQDYQNELRGKDGVGDKTIEQLMRDMEATERDLVNRMISAQTIQRQKNIETRLLESERAEQERDKEEQRESREAVQRYLPKPPKEWNFSKEKEGQIEMIKTIPPSLRYYYKEKVNQYFYNIE